mmetsp:Transcript_3355/g.8121  ORF Transcript_3355/g.8121 Transcript_3355/m.8121 type:complete len:235 (-) Transcript_3355:243-947(-)
METTMVSLSDMVVEQKAKPDMGASPLVLDRTPMILLDDMGITLSVGKSDCRSEANCSPSHSEASAPVTSTSITSRFDSSALRFCWSSTFWRSILKKCRAVTRFLPSFSLNSFLRKVRMGGMSARSAATLSLAWLASLRKAGPSAPTPTSERRASGAMNCSLVMKPLPRWRWTRRKSWLCMEKGEKRPKLGEASPNCVCILPEAVQVASCAILSSVLVHTAISITSPPSSSKSWR